jgi:23S rRNA pseudouridine1911/1915/1917 synthase
VKPGFIELPTGENIPILYEDRSALAIDKPRGWMLAPDSWRETGRNLQAALAASVIARDFWARSRNLRFIRYVHRLDAETTGVVLLAKSPGAVHALSRLFESREMAKVYLAVVHGAPRSKRWTCRAKLSADPDAQGRIRVDQRNGKEAETRFEVLQTTRGLTLIRAVPLTGRTHQIRVHLAEAGHPVVGDKLYGKTGSDRGALALRAIELAYVDPFTRRRVRIRAPGEEFVSEYGFDSGVKRQSVGALERRERGA